MKHKIIKRLIKLNIKVILAIILAIALVSVLFVWLISFKLKQSQFIYDGEEYVTGEAISIDYELIENGLPSQVVLYSDDEVTMSIDLISTNVIVDKHGERFETLKVDDTLSLVSRRKQRSPLRLTYFYEGSNRQYLLDGFTDSVSFKRYTMEKIEGGVKVTYVLSNNIPHRTWFPQTISKTMYDEIINLASPAEKQSIDISYDVDTINGVYRLKSTILQTDLDNLNTLFFTKYEYTLEDVIEINRNYNHNVFINKPEFHVPVLYYMDKGDLIVEIASNEIIENSLIQEENKEAIIQNIELLPHFGSTKRHDDAFIFVPDGSGAIIDLSVVEEVFGSYRKAVYNSNSLLTENFTKYVNNEQIKLPVFGISNGNQAIFGIIEKGDMQTDIVIENQTVNLDFSSIYTSHNYRYIDKYSISSNVSIDISSPMLNQTNYKIRYALLSSDKPITYMDFVEVYQAYIFGDQERQSSKIGIELEMLGSYNQRSNFIGIPYTETIVLTSYQEALNIMEENIGHELLRYSYTGWSNGGIRGDGAINPSHESRLGSLASLNRLIAYSETHDVALSLALNFITYYQNGRGFRSNVHGVKLVGNYNDPFYPIDPSTNRAYKSNEGLYYYLDLTYLDSLIDRFLDQNDTHYNNLTILDLASIFTANYNDPAFSPNVAKFAIIQALEKLSASKALTLSHPHAYAYTYANHITDLPYFSSRHHMFAYDIPFIQLVLNGHVAYTQPSINLELVENNHITFLKAIETNSNMKYTISSRSTEITKTSEVFNYIYSTQYSFYRDEINGYLEQLETVNDSIHEAYIINHETEHNVVKVTYSNGVMIYVNYNQNSVLIDGIMVEALNYKLVK